MVTSRLHEDRPNSSASRLPEIGFCREKNRLQGEFLKAIHEISVLQSQQTQAVIDGDEDFARFDLLLHLAQDEKEKAKYAWIAHLEQHGCKEGSIDEWDSRDLNVNESKTAG